MKKFLEELGKNGLAPTLMSGCAGFLIGTIVMGLVFHSWETPKLIEPASATDVVTTKNSATSSITTEAEAKAELERGCEIEGEDALNDIPEEYPEIVIEDAESNYCQIVENADFVREKLTKVDEDYAWTTVRDDLAQYIDDNLVIPKSQLDSAKPGQVLAVKKLADQTITISVPEILVDGKKNNDLDKYGVVQVFTIENPYSDNYHADATLYIYDKTQLSIESPLIFYGEDCWCTTSPIPYAPHFGVVSEEEFDISDDPGVYTARASSCSQFGYGTSGPVGDDVNIKFSKTRMSFDGGSFDKIKDWLEECSLGHRKTINECWNSDKSSYDLLGLFDYNTGKFAGELELVKVDQNLYYIQSTYVPTSLIVLQPNEISIAITEYSCISWEEEEDELWIGSYFKDTTNSSDLVSIEGTDLTLSKATIEALLTLLNENGVNWWTSGLSSIVTE